VIFPLLGKLPIQCCPLGAESQPGETQLKVRKRAWKIEWIASFNRDWNDLHQIIEHRPAPPPKLGSIARAAVRRLDGMTDR
jgi:hypothetical protein